MSEQIVENKDLGFEEAPVRVNAFKRFLKVFFGQILLGREELFLFPDLYFFCQLF